MTTSAEQAKTAGYETIATSVNDGLGLITIDRPHVRNALSKTVLAEIRSVLDDWEEDDAVRVLAFTGSGGKAFVAGADISQLANYDVAYGLAGAMQRLFDKIEEYPKPTIAGLNGIALGGGLELAMSCDIRICADTARFGLPEPNLGVIPGAGGTQRLSRLVGTGRAVEMVLTSRLLDAAEAERFGLATSVVPGEQLLEAVRNTAATIASKGPLAVRLAKMVIKQGAETDQKTGQMLELLAQTLLYTTVDKTEGVAAFLAKRPAEFQGR